MPLVHKQIIAVTSLLATASLLLSTAQAQESSVAATERRSDEVAAFLNSTYFKRIRPVSTTVTPSGQTIDWVDPVDLDPKYWTRKPPSEATDPNGNYDEQNMGEPVPMETEVDPSLRGPEGTVPVYRPNFSYFVDGRSDKESLQEFIASIPTPQPEGQDRLYGLRRHAVTNIGTQAWLNIWNFGQVPSDGMSLSQLSLHCGSGNSIETIELGFQKLPSLYGDSNIHIFSYFTTGGYGNQADYVRGYNQTVAGFVPYTGASFGPGATIPTPHSVVGGTQRERRLRVVRDGDAYWLQDWTGPSSFTWLGYYPIGSGEGEIPFNLIDDEACNVSWYGEVFDPTPTSWTSANMGSGEFAAEGQGNAAYVRGIIVERSSGNIWFSTAATTGGASDNNCYTVSAVSSGGSGWERSFFYGGPGGDATGCN